VSTILFGIAHTALLWSGAALIGVPIAIHYLFRRKHRVVRFAAMEFLLAALKKQKRRVQMENLLLLLMRCALIALLALALARPAIRSAALAPLGGSARGVILIVDTSASMAARTTGRRGLDRARDRARAFLQEMSEGSEVTVIVTRDDLSGGAPATLVEGALPSRARDRVERQLQLSFGPNDLPEVLRFARTKLATVRGRKSIVFITDLQERDWTGESGRRIEDLHRALRMLAERGEGGAIPVTILGAGSVQPDNIAVTDLIIEEGIEAFAGTTIGLAAEVVNYGRAPATGTLTLYTSPSTESGWERRDPVRSVTIPPSLIAGEPRPELVDLFVPLPADQTGLTKFKVVFRPDKGPSDRLDLDNERYLSLDVRPPARILPVRSFRGSLELIKDVEVAKIISFLNPVFPEELAVTDLSRIDVIVWADADFHELDEGGAERLRQFVARGGGLLAYLGDYARPAARINEYFFREEGKGLFPMLVQEGEPVRVVEGGAPVLIDVAAADQEGKGHILFRDATFALSPEIVSYRPVSEVPEEAVVARYNNEQRAPAVLAHRYGLGRVVIATTTPDERGFRVAGSLLPPIFFFNAVHYLVAEDAARRNVTVGQSVRIPLLTGARRVSIEPPAGAGGMIEEPVEEDATFFLLTRTTHPGFYSVTVRAAARARGALDADRPHLAAINIDATESDLRPIRTADLKRLYPRTTLKFATNVDEVSPTLGTEDDGEISRALLASVVGMLFFELFAAWRFGSRRRRAA
jgi:hypothetical protein